MIFRQTRHIILLVLLAGMALFLTKEFWFFPSEKAVRVSFTSQAAQPIDYQVFYTASPDRSFNPEEKVTQNISRETTSKYIDSVSQSVAFPVGFGTISARGNLIGFKSNRG